MWSWQVSAVIILAVSATIRGECLSIPTASSFAPCCFAWLYSIFVFITLLSFALMLICNAVQSTEVRLRGRETQKVCVLGGGGGTERT